MAVVSEFERRHPGVKVIVGKKASETVHYGHMDKGNKLANYMPLNATSIGYRYNLKALIDFFVANPTTNFASFTMVKAKVTLKAEEKWLGSQLSDTKARQIVMLLVELDGRVATLEEALAAARRLLDGADGAGAGSS